MLGNPPELCQTYSEHTARESGQVKRKWSFVAMTPAQMELVASTTRTRKRSEGHARYRAEGQCLSCLGLHRAHTCVARPAGRVRTTVPRTYVSTTNMMLEQASEQAAHAKEKEVYADLAATGALLDLAASGS